MASTMDVWTVVRDVVVALSAAVTLGFLAQRMRLSPVVGYLSAGLLVGGPGSLELVKHVDVLNGIAEIGVALLLFTLGLDVSLYKLRLFGRLALIAGTLQVVTTITVTTALVANTSASLAVAIVIGMATALSSTAVVVRVLTDTTQADSQFGLAAIGVLLMQDLLLIPCLLLIPDLDGSTRPVGIIVAMVVSVGKIAALAVTMFLVQRLLLSRLLNLVASASAREELLVIASVIIAFGAAWVTHAMGLSAELGAFMAGLMIASEAYADHVRAELNPLKIVLVTLFFSVIGMLADVSFIAVHLLLIIELVVLVIVGKTLISAGALLIAGSARVTSLLGGIALAQMGEFSFVLATSAYTMGILSLYQFQLVLSVSLVTLILSPVLLPIATRIAVRAGADHITVDDVVTDNDGRCVVIGYGPAGQRVVARLVEHDRAVTVIDLNPQTPRYHEVDVLHGDANKTQILRRGGVAQAHLVVVTIPDPLRAAGMVRRIKELNPSARVVARGRYQRMVSQLYAAGATTVVDEETEAGDRLADDALAFSEPAATATATSRPL
ncbi:MAG: cation:proton antiporter [Thermoleophilia bacterium]|nr:cation:proton antiporter [Thermoleophilia bacterium]